jgi:SMC interacting uncharacterized protein involved in chromosome segregation
MSTENEMLKNLKNLENLDEIINKLNDQLGMMGNNLIEKQIELDYLKEINEKLNQINKKLIDQMNKKYRFTMMF